MTKEKAGMTIKKTNAQCNDEVPDQVGDDIKKILLWNITTQQLKKNGRRFGKT